MQSYYAADCLVHLGVAFQARCMHKDKYLITKLHLKHKTETTDSEGVTIVKKCHGTDIDAFNSHHSQKQLYDLLTPYAAELVKCNFEVSKASNYKLIVNVRLWTSRNQV